MNTTRAFLAALVVAIIRLVHPVQAEVGCINCGGLFGDTCYSSASALEMQRGYFYELRTECERQCNGPEENGPKTCKVTMASENKTKYQLTGSAGVDWAVKFGLQGGWESETITTSACEQTSVADEPNECCGPLYGYFKYEYIQKACRKYNETQSAYCYCSSYTITAVLKKNPSSLCTGTQHGAWEPPQKDLIPWCTDHGWQ
jgi:hypothetical protein